MCTSLAMLFLLKRTIKQYHTDTAFQNYISLPFFRKFSHRVILIFSHHRPVCPFTLLMGIQITSSLFVILRAATRNSHEQLQKWSRSRVLGSKGGPISTCKIEANYSPKRSYHYQSIEDYTGPNPFKL